MEYKLVKVMWQDHISIAEWLPLESAISMKPALAETIGWVIHDCDEYMIVAGERDTIMENYSNMTVIIKSCIIGMKEL